MTRYFFLTLAVLASAACSTTGDAPAPAAAAAPLKSGIDVANMDPSVRPQDDFYRYVNGTWLKNTPIPSDKPGHNAFYELYDRSQERLRAIIEESANKPDKQPGTPEQKVGDMYTSFMNEAHVEELGLAPLKGELDLIDSLKSKSEIPALMAHFDRIAVGTPIGSYIDQDHKDATQYIAYYMQSGLGLPDRDYYLLPDKKFKDIRAAYRAHVEKMLALSGDKAAAKDAKAIVALETALAKKQWTQVESRDDEKTYNKFEVAKANALTPGFDFAAFLKADGVTTPSVIVFQPSAFTGFAGQLKAQPLSVWKAYFRWHLVHDYAKYLTKALVDENFAFYGKTLFGTQEQRPRWKRGVSAVEGALGEALGQIYVDRHFSPQAKQHMEQLVQNLLAAYKQSITSLDWMSEETRKQALVKLAKFTPKIGYPNKWRDYSTLKIAAGDLAGNVMRSAEFEHAWQFGKLGRPIDRDEWQLTPQTINAYYNPGMNEIVFPAAILDPPFFNLEAEDAVNYGGIGAVIGHEIGHGFDDQGSKYDGDGNMRSWWTDADRKQFETRTHALIEEYNQFEPIPGQKINGALTIGENIGDLGGASIALAAYRLSLNGKPAPVIDGLSAEQRFFMGYCQIWRAKFHEGYLLAIIKSDPHSPDEYRCTGALANVPEFYTTYGVEEGDRMYTAPEKRVKIW
jgi:putative endopeptidase